MESDESRYRRFLAGDESAMDELIKKYFDQLLFFICRYIQDVDEAEDLVMDVFADIIFNKQRFNFRVTFKTYLYMIGRSRALNYLRHARLIKTVNLDAAENVAQKKQVEEIVLNNEKKRQLNEAIQKLPEDAQAILQLIYMDGLSYEEVAQIMKISKKLVDNTVYRSKTKLREILMEQEKDEKF